MNLVEGNSNYQALETTNCRNDPDQMSSILFKESRAFEMYILKEVKGWIVKFIASKYGKLSKRFYEFFIKLMRKKDKRWFLRL